MDVIQDQGKPGGTNGLQQNGECQGDQFFLAGKRPVFAGMKGQLRQFRPERIL